MKSRTQWHAEVRSFCETEPIVLLGMKKDTRPAAPTLRLPFLNEPIPVTVLQVSCPFSPPIGYCPIPWCAVRASRMLMSH